MATELIVKSTKLMLVRGDITQQKVEAIVNAANSGLMGGGGVDGAIHRVGGSAIVEECRRIVSQIGRLAAGKAVITTGGNLPAKYVIHTVGPVWRGGGNSEGETLASCYTESLKIASDKGLTSIAFPAISTGVYGYPQDQAAKIAIDAAIGYLKDNSTSLIAVHFVVYDGNAYKIYANELDKVAA
ncbi:MAG: O-acetyl-ADP-ribose deacetylase [Chloroflexi bacterium]|nr:O-acetyl-ADP-ribose deacetylase [Chloroflexota bacterium]